MKKSYLMIFALAVMVALVSCRKEDQRRVNFDVALTAGMQGERIGKVNVGTFNFISRQQGVIYSTDGTGADGYCACLTYRTYPVKDSICVEYELVDSLIYDNEFYTLKISFTSPTVTSFNSDGSVLQQQRGADAGSTLVNQGKNFKERGAQSYMLYTIDIDADGRFTVQPVKH